ncbi:MAG: dockerin type I domain-containing protein, partial [Ruminococcus sp.]|nr:dockerin type I domain-containing protein [Ruminococcus sp.]
EPSTEATEPSTEATEPTETQPVVSDVYVVAGSELLCGVNWNGNADEATDNVMVEADGVYTKVFTDVQPAEGLQLKVVKNNTDWIGDETGNNITFNVTTACDVTVTFDPATSKITVTGDGVEFVTELEVEAMYAVGAGDENWLHGVVWNPAAEENKMTEISEKVYQITYTDVAGFAEGYQVKFAANGTWNDSWGGVYTEGAEFDAVYNGDNLIVPVNYDLADITLTLDLTAFDYATKTGAKATITIVEKKAAILYGDVNLDGTIDVTDVTCIQMYLAKYENAVDAELGATLADVTGDGYVDVTDVTALQKYLAGGYTNTGVAGTEYVAA